MIREITKRITYQFPILEVEPVIKQFISFSTHTNIPNWILSRNPTYSIFLEDLQIITYLPSLPLIAPLVFTGAESDSQIGVAVLEQKKLHTVANGKAIDYEIYLKETPGSQWVEIARESAYNLGFLKYTNLRVPYLTTNEEALTGFDFNSSLGIRVAGQNRLTENDQILLTGWYRVIINFDDLDEQINLLQSTLQSGLSGVNDSLIANQTAITSLTGTVSTISNNFGTFANSLNANTSVIQTNNTRLTTNETKLNTLTTTVNGLTAKVDDILLILSSGSFTPSPTPTPNPTPTPSPTPTPDPTPTPTIEDDMPYFANTAALVSNDAFYFTGQTVLLGTTGTTNYPVGCNTWLFIDNVTIPGNFNTDPNRLAFTYKTGAFINITQPAYIGSSNDSLQQLKNMPTWLINILHGREILVFTEEVNGFPSQKRWEKYILQKNNDTPPLFTLRIALTNDATYQLKLLSNTPVIHVTNSINIASANNFTSYISPLVTSIRPGDELIFLFKSFSGSLGTLWTTNLRVRIIGRESSGEYDQNFYSAFAECFGTTDTTLSMDHLLAQHLFT